MSADLSCTMIALGEIVLSKFIILAFEFAAFPRHAIFVALAHCVLIIIVFKHQFEVRSVQEHIFCDTVGKGWVIWVPLTSYFATSCHS